MADFGVDPERHKYDSFGLHLIYDRLSPISSRQFKLRDAVDFRFKTRCGPIPRRDAILLRFHVWVAVAFDQTEKVSGA